MDEYYVTVIEEKMYRYKVKAESGDKAKKKVEEYVTASQDEVDQFNDDEFLYTPQKKSVFDLKVHDYVETISQFTERNQYGNGWGDIIEFKKKWEVGRFRTPIKNR